jgi:streptogramin lyase
MRFRSTFTAVSIILLAIPSSIQAIDLLSVTSSLYVGLDNNNIVTYDTSSGVSATIEASVSTFTSLHLNVPLGLAFDISGNLYAVNNGDNTISKFNSAGVYQTNGSIGSTHLYAPSCLTFSFDNSGVLYVDGGVDSSNTQVQSFIAKYNSSGLYLSSITTNTNLNYPRGIAFDPFGNLYVANAGKNTISIFNPFGGYQGSITTNLKGPRGIAFDSLGNLYAANANNTISKFNSAGLYQSSISIGLNGPSGIAFDSSGNLFAANTNNNSISVYSPSGAFLTSWATGSGQPYYIAFKPITAPEPSTYALSAIATGLITYLAIRRRYKSHVTS